MAVDVSKLESHELASPGRWHVLCRNPLTLDAGVVHFVDGQSVAALDWPALRRAVASIGHEFLVARREDGLTVPEGDRWIEEARTCMGTRTLREPWASLLAVPKDDGNDDASGEDGDVSKLESHELASPGRWHVLCRNPLTLDAGVVHFVDGQSVAALDWPALRRAVASIGHEFLVARREDGLTVPEGDRWIEEARTCMGTRTLREPWASLLAVPKDDGNDDASGEDGGTQNASEGDEGEGEPEPENVSREAAPGVPMPTAGDVPKLGPEDFDRIRGARIEPIEIAAPDPFDVAEPIAETPGPVETPELVEKPKRARKRKNASEGDEG